MRSWTSFRRHWIVLRVVDILWSETDDSNGWNGGSVDGELDVGCVGVEFVYTAVFCWVRAIAVDVILAGSFDGQYRVSSHRAWRSGSGRRKVDIQVVMSGHFIWWYMWMGLAWIRKKQSLGKVCVEYHLLEEVCVASVNNTKGYHSMSPCYTFVQACMPWSIK